MFKIIIQMYDKDSLVYIIFQFVKKNVKNVFLKKNKYAALHMAGHMITLKRQPF